MHINYGDAHAKLCKNFLTLRSIFFSVEGAYALGSTMEKRVKNAKKKLAERLRIDITVWSYIVLLFVLVD
jgi:uncharacterized protein (UPF0303 family)